MVTMKKIIKSRDSITDYTYDAPSSTTTKTTLNKISSQIKKSTGAATDTIKKMPGMIHQSTESTSISAGGTSFGRENDEPFESSEGAMRLNRILSENKSDTTKKVFNVVSPKSSESNLLPTNSTGERTQKQELDYIPPSTVQLPDPTDEIAVGEMTCRISSKRRVDVRSIGGRFVAADGKVEARTGNVLLKEGWEEYIEGTTTDNGNSHGMKPINRLTNECLFSMCVSQFDLSKGLSGGPSGGKKRHIPTAKTRNKLQYVVIVRSTNRPLLRPRSMAEDVVAEVDEVLDASDGSDEDVISEDGYDHLYNPDPSESIVGGKSKKQKRDKDVSKHEKKVQKLYDDYDCGIAPEKEISSFPALLCLAIHADGTKPDVRKIFDLDKLVSIQNCPPRKDSLSAGHVILVFHNGDTVEIDCDLPNVMMHSIGVSTRPLAAHAGKQRNTPVDGANRVRKERFLWSLLQIHAILCTAVVERTSATVALSRPSSLMTINPLPPLKVLNIDRGELQYISTVKGFLTESPVLCSLLDRFATRSRMSIAAGSHSEEKKFDERCQEEKSHEFDGMAYDMMMGNYHRVALFLNEEEKQEAADILNTIPWQQQEVTSDGATNADASATAESLIKMLQQRMRELEAETCQRLISWEDEKYFSATGERPEGDVGEKSNNTLSLDDLFITLQLLDDELKKMEIWIQDRARMVKPITDECCGIEEENRMLEQQWVSYEMLGTELKRLLGGLIVPPGLMSVLENPGSVIVYDESGSVNIDSSREGVEMISQAGQALKLALDTAENEGGIHLRAVSDTVKVLSTTCNKFCRSVARIIVTVMEQLAKSECSRPDVSIGLGDTHSSVAKKIRETQRRFQASLLSYIQMIEVLALLKPDILPAVRDAYSELVAEGVMSKKRMKAYFASLPGKTSIKHTHDTTFDTISRSVTSVTHDLSEYKPASLRYVPPEPTGMLSPLNVEDIEAVLNEMLPIIAREAYFTAALFGLSSRHLDGRQKKRNFEAAKFSVDNSSQWFRYYMDRICGIASDVDGEGKKMKGDAMQSLVASIHLNEAMDGYIDRNKKGGDHSLSLAYVRATILDLRKKVDKQWVTWVEEQIQWIRTNPGVPLNGKRAGIFDSIVRFPTYLDHVLICCTAGRLKEYSPNIGKIKVVSYYLQKMASALFASLNECAERETTDQQYASNVMRMENSYFLTQSIKQRGPELASLFQKQISGASVICKQSTDAYLGWMIKREFKAMHSLFSNISRIRKDVGDADVPIHVPRAQFVRTLQKESSKEIMKEKIGVVYARMEKHLSESGGLLPMAWKALVKVLYEWFGRWEKLSTSCYKFILEPSAIDVVRLAKAVSSGKSSVSEGNRHEFITI